MKAIPFHADTSLSPARSGMGRDEAIDVIRGFCIISMVTGHIAGGTLVSSAFHIFPKFDGASGFVLLSGLVLGRVQSRRVASSGLARVEHKSLRRIALVYVLQVFLVLVGLLGVVAGWRNSNYPPLDSLSVFEMLAHSMMMTLAPPGGDVLRIYVFLLAIAMGGYVLLSRGHWAIFLGLSILLHIVAQVYPLFSSFSPFSEQAPSAGWAGWQLLFVTALIIGWYWNNLDIGSWLGRHSKAVFFICVATLVCISTVSTVVPAPVDEALFNKYSFPVGRIIAAYAVVVLLYVAAGWCLQRISKIWFRPLSMIGKRSLDSYVIQAVAVVAIFGFTSVSSSSLTSVLLSLLTLVLCWGWAEIRGRRGSSRTQESRRRIFNM